MIAAGAYQPNFTNEVVIVRHQPCSNREGVVTDRPQVFARSTMSADTLWLSLRVFALTPSTKLGQDSRKGRLIVRIDDQPKILLTEFSDKGQALNLGLSGLPKGRHRILYYLETGLGIPSYGQICVHV
jgi:hypothetical protein